MTRKRPFPARSSALVLAASAGLALAACVGAGGNLCPVQGCGSNTPVLSGSKYFEAFSLKQKQSPGAYSYVEGSFRCGMPAGVAGPIELTARDEKLVGIDSAGNVACEGDALVGSKFLIMPPHATQPVPIRIGEVAHVATWHRISARRELLRTYQFQSPRGDGTWESICPIKTATWMEDWQVEGLVSGTKNPSDVTGSVQWHAASDHLLVIHGETYTQAAEVDAANSGPSWLTIACAGAAFSKMRLLGYTPVPSTSTPSTPNERAATLKMLTARYRGEKAHTEPGMPLGWKAMNGIAYYGTPLRATLGPVEALWGAKGATCLSHGRVWRKSDPRYLGRPGGERTCLRRILPRRCTGLERATGASIMSAPSSWTASVPAGVVWATVTVDHVKHEGGPSLSRAVSAATTDAGSGTRSRSRRVDTRWRDPRVGSRDRTPVPGGAGRPRGPGAPARAADDSRHPR